MEIETDILRKKRHKQFSRPWIVVLLLFFLSVRICLWRQIGGPQPNLALGHQKIRDGPEHIEELG
jgi:hypothetical protein